MKGHLFCLLVFVLYFCIFFFAMCINCIGRLQSKYHTIAAPTITYKMKLTFIIIYNLVNNPNEILVRCEYMSVYHTNVATATYIIKLTFIIIYNSFNYASEMLGHYTCEMVGHYACEMLGHYTCEMLGHYTCEMLWHYTVEMLGHYTCEMLGHYTCEMLGHYTCEMLGHYTCEYMSVYHTIAATTNSVVIYMVNLTFIFSYF